MSIKVGTFEVTIISSNTCPPVEIVEYQMSTDPIIVQKQIISQSSISFTA